MATVAVFIALGGSAYAAIKVGSASIIDNSIRSVDLRNNSIASADLRNGGIATADMSSGARTSFTDTSPWETIPSGKTIRGEFAFHDSVAGSLDYDYSIHFPARAPVPLISTNVNFAQDALAKTTDDDATCTGLATAPTAPPGRVCIYILDSDADAWALSGFRQVLLSDAGFRIAWSDAGGTAESFLRGSWAYTAP